MRVIFDTNIVISALLTPTGLAAEALLIWITDAGTQLCPSADIYAEYEEVIRRPTFNRNALDIDAVLSMVRKLRWIEPNGMLHVCLDPDDDIFLECAQAANAHYIVTGNTRHFPRIMAASSDCHRPPVCRRHYWHANVMPDGMFCSSTLVKIHPRFCEAMNCTVSPITSADGSQ